MARVAIIGSCITRDIWPILDEPPPQILYFPRTSLPSLVSSPVAGLAAAGSPPQGLSPSQHAAVLADLSKTALDAVAAFRPTHLVLDFIDERYDLLEAEGAIFTHSWDLKVSGYLDQPWARGARRIARTSAECADLWRAAAPRFADALRRRGLLEARVILHEAQWADAYRTAAGELRPLPDTLQIWDDLPARRAEHNALLTDYQQTLAELIPGLVRVRADPALVLADEAHRWGLSPFHYVRGYYADVRRQLAEAGI